MIKPIVYVAIWKDRHADTTAHVFSDADAAVEWAKAQAREYDRFGDLDEGLTDAMKAGPDPWLYYGRYSCEGDCIIVVPIEIDKELK